MEVAPVAVSMRRRTSFIARAAPGNSLPTPVPSKTMTVAVRDSTRPRRRIEPGPLPVGARRRPRVATLGGGAPRQGGQRPAQRRLVLLDCEQVVRPTADQVVGVAALGVVRV